MVLSFNSIVLALVVLVISPSQSRQQSDMVVRVKECINNEYSCTKNCTTFDIPQGQCMVSGDAALEFRCEEPFLLDYLEFQGPQCDTAYPFYNQSSYCNLCMPSWDQGPHHYCTCDNNFTSMDMYTCLKCPSIDQPGQQCTHYASAKVDRCETVTAPITEKQLSIAPVGRFYQKHLIMYQMFHHANCSDTGPVLISWSVVPALSCGFGYGNSNLVLSCVPKQNA